jgi:uncharacterized membrane protein
MNRAAAVLLLAALLAAAVPVPAKTLVGPEWWGPTDPDAGWHMRVTLTVQNTFPESVFDAPVAAELDLGQALVDAGWTSFDSGGRDILTGFTLDPSSIRVVQYHNLEPFAGSGSDGLPTSEDAIPSLAIPGLLGRSDSADAARPYDPSTSPLVTVFFRVPGELKHDEMAFFEVYFDSLTNGAKEPPAYAGPAGGALQALHWTTSGTVLYGHAVTSATPNKVTILGLQDNTQVTVERLAGGKFTTSGVTLGKSTLMAGENTEATLTGTDPVFRVSATAPVVADVDATGFVPSVEGSLTGKEFRFRTPADGSGTAGVYLINAGTSTAKVQVDGVSGTFTLTALPGAAYGGSNPCNTLGPWKSLAQSTNHHVTVVEGGPIMVQLQPRTMQQVPAADGSPAGTRFVATALWSSFSNCNQGLGQPFRAASTGAATTIRAVNLETGQQVSPVGAGTHAVPAAAVSDGLFLDTQRAANRDRPLYFESGAPVRVYAGGNPSPSPAAGPFGGSGAGLQFTTLGRTLLVAPYPETHVQAQVKYASGAATVTQLLGAGGVATLLDDASFGRVQSAAVQADRPILAYSLDASPGFLAGIPGYLKVVEDRSGVAQYRGRLVEIRSQSGEDPVTLSVKGGETTTLPLFVANRGQGVSGAPAPQEPIHIAVSGVPSGWTATLDRNDVTLPPDSEAAVSLLLKPPAGSEASPLPVQFTVTAFSRDKTTVRDDLTVIASIQNSFGVGLWFVQADTGPKTASLSTPPGTTATYPVVVKNLGSQQAAILLNVETKDAPAAAHLEDLQGEPVDALDMAPGEVRNLNLTVAAGDRPDALLLTTVTGTVDRAAGRVDRITALTRVRTAAELNLTTGDALHLLRDGEEGQFTVTLQNAGGGAADLRLRLLSDAPADWPAPSLFLVDPVTGQRVPVTRFTLDPQAKQDFRLNVTPPAGTPAGTLVALQVVVTPSSGSPVDLPLTGVIAARHRVQVDFASDPAQAPPGRPTSVPVTFTNRGNLDESLRAEMADLPPGWTVVPPALAPLERQAVQDAALVIDPGSTAPGSYRLGFRLVASDGAGLLSTLNVTVPARAGQAVGGNGTLDGQPGRALPFEVPVANRGNLPVLATLSAAPGEAWGLNATAIRLQPGANGTLTASWLVPRSAPDGATAHRAVLRLAGDGGASSEATLQRTVAVGRPDVLLENASAASGPAGGLVRAVVRNAGDRPAFDVRVVLEAPGEDAPLAEQTLLRVEAGEQADLLLAVGRSVPSGAVLRLDPDDAIVESNDANNVASSLEGSGSHGAAAAPAAFALAALAVGLALRRRRA